MFSLKHNLIAITFVVIAICTLQVMSYTADQQAAIRTLLETHCGFQNNIDSDKDHDYEDSLRNTPNRDELETLLDKLKPSIPKINTSDKDEVELSARRIANVYQTRARLSKYQEIYAEKVILLNPEDPIGSLASSVDINAEIP